MRAVSESPQINQIPIISLFSGCGAFDLGFSHAGFEVLLALDINDQAVESYNHNRTGKVAQLADLSQTSSDEIAAMLPCNTTKSRPRGVIGGSPCQSFSCANVHARFDDARHELPRKFASILKGLNDRFNLDFFVFENVRGLTFKKHTESFQEFKRLFEFAGFKLFEGLLDAADFGVAQHRPRVFVVGLNAARYGEVEFCFPPPNCTKVGTVEDAIRHLPQPAFFERGLDVTAITPHRNHWTMQPKSAKFSSGELVPGYKSGRSFRVLDWKKPSWAVAYGNREIHVHPSGKRRLSVYEALLLQGLPPEYELCGNLSDQIRQVSDAVPPQLGKAIGQAIATLLKGQEAP